MKHLFNLKTLLAAFIFLSFFVFSNEAFAAKKQIVLFCSGWNLKCRDAKMACSSAASDLGYIYTEFDVDDPNTPVEAAKLNLAPPPSIPYVYLLNERNNVVKGFYYQGKSSAEIKQRFQ